MIDKGAIIDGKTILLLYYAAHHHLVRKTRPWDGEGGEE